LDAVGRGASLGVDKGVAGLAVGGEGDVLHVRAS
jgi:hypothetical protein